MKSKFFDIVAIISFFGMILFSMALDAESLVYTYICLGCGIYVAIYITIKGYKEEKKCGR